MAKRKEITPEEHTANQLASELKEIKERIQYGILSLNPTRQFEVGQRIQMGAHAETYVLENCENGLYYKIILKNVQRERNKPDKDEIHYEEWVHLFPYETENTTFRKEEKYRITLLNCGIDSLLNMIYHAGVDFDVEYQREHVWGLDDKVLLIDSIFNNINIGTFVFVQRSFSTIGKLYEIIDGKQRLTAIKEFYEDRFPYKGFYFSQLSWRDKHKFTSHSVSYGYLENPDLRGIYETFIKLNTCGKPMDRKHIDKVKTLLNELGN